MELVWMIGGFVVAKANLLDKVVEVVCKVVTQVKKVVNDMMAPNKRTDDDLIGKPFTDVISVLGKDNCVISNVCDDKMHREFPAKHSIFEKEKPIKLSLYHKDMFDYNNQDESTSLILPEGCVVTTIIRDNAIRKVSHLPYHQKVGFNGPYVRMDCLKDDLTLRSDDSD